MNWCHVLQCVDPDLNKDIKVQSTLCIIGDQNPSWYDQQNFASIDVTLNALIARFTTKQMILKMLCIFLVRYALWDSNAIVFDEPGWNQKFCINASPWKVSKKKKLKYGLRFWTPMVWAFMPWRNIEICRHLHLVQTHKSSLSIMGPHIFQIKLC